MNTTVRGAHRIGKRLVEESMSLVNTQQAAGIRVCKCAMSGAIQRMMNDFKHLRFNFLVDGYQRPVWINAGYIFKHDRINHV